MRYLCIPKNSEMSIKYEIHYELGTHKERMAENLSLFDFELDADDLQAIASLDTKRSLFFDPTTVM